MTEFIKFGKIPRYSRDCIITEKIDGTNGVVWIGENGEMLAGSRTRWLDSEHDNHGFYKWVVENQGDLLNMGPGYHFGEWWGSGINRGYDLPQGEKRWSLFNTKWTLDPEWATKKPACVQVVPIVAQGLFSDALMHTALFSLQTYGSLAAPGYMRPEGVVIFHVAGHLYFKRTIENDEKPKGLVEEF